MVLDLLTYIVMMAILGRWVLLSDGGEFNWEEVIFGLYIMVSIFIKKKA